MGIHHKHASAKYPRRRCNECCAELKSHVNQVEKIGGGAKDRYWYSQFPGDSDACSNTINSLWSINNWKVIEEGIYENSN